MCDRAAVVCSDDHTFLVPVLGHQVSVHVPTRAMKAGSQESEFMLTKTAYFSRLSILHYLLGAQNVPPTGRLLNPTELRSSQIYFQGSHRLPLDAIAARFSKSAEDFLALAARLGGRPQDHGDAAVELLPFPRVPMTLILWLEDDEFPARSYLLFDEVCEHQLPLDVLWSTAMMCTLAMLRLPLLPTERDGS